MEAAREGLMGNNVVFRVWSDLKSILKVGLRSTVAKNAASLYVIQFAQYILPLITVPYLVRVLRPSGYGLVAFGQSFIAYFAILADFGFAYSATRKISLEREDISAVSRTASNVWASKALLAIIGFLILLLSITFVPKLQESAVLLLVLYGTVVGSVLFPTWLFQGMERMVAISMINLVMQFFILIGVFTFIHRPEDYLTYAALISSGSILSGITGAFIALYMFKIRPVFPSMRGIIETLREGWVLFLSMASVSLYTAGNAFILGLLASNAAVGYYSAAEKIVKAVLGLLGPITQATFPRFSKMVVESKDSVFKWGQRMLLMMGALGLALSAFVFICAPLIVQILLGSQYGPSIVVMRILSLLLFAISVNNVLGIQLMLALRHDKAFTLVVLAAGILNIILAIILAPIWEATGMAVAVVSSEIFIIVAEILYLQYRYSFVDICKKNLKGFVHERVY